MEHYNNNTNTDSFTLTVVVLQYQRQFDIIAEGLILKVTK